MKIFKKLLSVALASAIVAGCGALVNADTKYAIDSNNFPDPVFRQYVKTEFDSNKDGYLDYKEQHSRTSINLSCLDIESIKGIELLYVNQLTMLEIPVSEVDLTRSRSITKVMIFSCNMLRSFKGYVYQNHVEIAMCDYLKTVDVSSCTYLKKLTLVRNRRLASLDLSENKYLKEIQLNSDIKLTSVKFNDEARIEYLDIEDSPVTGLDVSKVFDLKTTHTFILSTDGELRSLRVSGTVLNFLWNHRKPDHTGYEYRTKDQYILIT